MLYFVLLEIIGGSEVPVSVKTFNSAFGYSGINIRM